MVARRWITVGIVQGGWFVNRGNCGFSNGWLVYWQGRRTFGQPMEFIGWRELSASVRRRLSFAGLEPVAEAVEVRPYYGSGRERRLLVQVERTKKNRL
jgi:hypothetical protein